MTARDCSKAQASKVAALQYRDRTPSQRRELLNTAGNSPGTCTGELFFQADLFDHGVNPKAVTAFFPVGRCSLNPYLRKDTYFPQLAHEADFCGTHTSKERKRTWALTLVHLTSEGEGGGVTWKPLQTSGWQVNPGARGVTPRSEVWTHLWHRREHSEEKLLMQTHPSPRQIICAWPKEAHLYKSRQELSLGSCRSQVNLFHWVKDFSVHSFRYS